MLAKLNLVTFGRNFCKVQIVTVARREMSGPSGKKVYVTRNVPQSGVAALRATGCSVTQWNSDKVIPRDELLKNVPGIDGLFCLLTDKIDKEVLDSAGNQLKVVGTMSVGYEHLDLAEIRRRGIKIGYTPDVLTDATAELGVSLLLAVSRNIVRGEKAVRTGEWSTWSPLWMCGQGLAGSRVGIVGLGRIGLGIAHRLKPFGVSEILYTGRKDKSYASEVGAIRVEFNDLLSRSDFVIVTCPLTPDTKELFNASTFSLMKRSAIFVNIARSGIVNQNDLLNALKSGVIAAAGLDVTTPEPLPPNHELLSLPNCVILPHIGSATVETRSDMSKLTAENILSVFRGDPMPSELKA